MCSNIDTIVGLIVNAIGRVYVAMWHMRKITFTLMSYQFILGAWNDILVYICNFQWDEMILNPIKQPQLHMKFEL